MSFERDFLELMPDTVTITQRSGSNAYGEHTFSGATTHRARIVKKIEMLRTIRGEEKVSDTVVWVAGNGTFPNVEPDDKVTLPDGTTRPVLQIHTFGDDDGNHHVKVYLGEIG